ncbi:hypothetical protein GCM10010178_90570 [Lentzea flava]|uniref:Protein kinase domain-containing protein n=1 Tax=Lentzea flava TaxID=103732 RepID=A0ABQ2VHD7_9PSEU|nr:hypothetical protein GCM10010178_90570 [Lentzea flava]
MWQARRLKDGATVAIKIPKDQEKGEEVLRKESEIIREIRHPNIVRVHGFHNISELFVIEMEFVDGYDLAKVLDSVSTRAPLTLEQMLEWTMQILDGLAAVHAANISHNDLKPQNILVDKASGVAKITDFGSSRRLEDVWVWTKRHGTEAYMAPEVALEGKRARDVSDIYSIGVLLYEMATGRLPYSTPHQLLTGIQVAKPRDINRDVPADLEDVILRAIAWRPENRFQNCGSMRAAVHACLDRLRAEEAAAACQLARSPASSASSHLRRVRSTTSNWPSSGSPTATLKVPSRRRRLLSIGATAILSTCGCSAASVCDWVTTAKRPKRTSSCSLPSIVATRSKVISDATFSSDSVSCTPASSSTATRW